MADVTVVIIPDGIDGEAIRHDMLNNSGIVIGPSFGPLYGRLLADFFAMGHVCRRENILRCLGALITIPQRNGFTTPSKAGVNAAENCFGADK